MPQVSHCFGQKLFKMTEINVLFGTETGTAEEAAHDAVRFFASRGIRCALQSADELPLEQWQMRPTVILVSTTGQGEFPRTISGTWETLRMSDAPDLPRCRFAVFGLGDSSYAKFNFPAKMLHNRLKQLGGEPLVHRGLGNEQDGEGYEQVLQPWLKSVALALGHGDDAAQLPKFVHKFSVATAPDTDRETSPSTLRLTVVKNIRLTSLDHFQAVHNVEFQRNSSALDYKPGDSLAVSVKNTPAVVESLCRFIYDFQADQVVIVEPKFDDFLLVQPKSKFVGRAMTVRMLLMEFFDITSAVPRSFLRMLSAFATDAEEKERLEELSASSRLEEYNAYCYREKRCPAEVLEDFPSARPPLSALLSVLKVLQPRRFSISSSSLLDKDVISLTVAKLEFVTPYGRKRQGLCSTLLCDSTPGQQFDVSLSAGSLELPESSTSPLVLVGPGTGFAPVRSILRHCVAVSWTGSINVFVGFRKKLKDFLYRDELERYFPAMLPGLKVFTAFSRDQRAKCYVQHLMTEEPARSSLAADLVHETACVFVCGNSKQMPQDVQDAIRSVMKAQGVSDIISQLSSEGRLFMDTWSS